MTRSEALWHPLAPIPVDSPAGQEIAAAWRAAVGAVCPLCHETRRERRLGSDLVIVCGCPAHADDPPEAP